MTAQFQMGAIKTVSGTGTSSRRKRQRTAALRDLAELAWAADIAKRRGDGMSIGGG